MKKSILFLLFALCCQFAWSQTNAAIWTNRQASELSIDQSQVIHGFASNYRMVELEPETVATNLLATHKNIRQIILPTPNGEMITVDLAPVSVMAPGLAARYPGIQTYKVLPKGKTIYGGRVGWTIQGLHATVRTNEGTLYIDPYLVNNQRIYVSYYVEDNIDVPLWRSFECGENGSAGLDPSDIYTPVETLEQQDKSILGDPIVQRKYRLAMACTGEFSTFHGGTTASALGAIVTIVNRVNEVYGRELAVQLELIENNDEVIFLDNQTDPYNNQTNDMQGINDVVLNSNVGSSAYDIGHVISTGPSVGQGLAALRSVCIANRKAQGASTRSMPQGDPFIINILCHELGHQFGGTHVQSGCQNVSIESAVEPGGGTTIMGYAGICPAGYNLQTNSEDYYNNSSLVQMIDYTRNNNGDACGTRIDEGNTLPEVTLDYENNFYIPISTPFQLTASADDMDEGDELTYCWEQRNINASFPYDDDNGVYGPFPGTPIGDSPLFRSLPPTDSPTRVFPRLSRIINNQMNNDEVLPTYSRNMDFRCTVRDNHPTSGALDWKAVSFDATDEAGPFLVTSPNEVTDVWTVGDYTEVTWDVANTDGALVNCQRVNISLSIDGGFTYPIMLLENTANDGSAFVTVPDEVGNDVRVRIDAANNIFFDISNRDFTIEPATEAGYALDYGPVFQTACAPENQAIVNIETVSILDYDGQIDFAITSTLPDGITASFGSDNIMTGATNSITLDFSQSTFDGLLTVDYSINAPDQPESIRSFEVEVVNSNFSALALEGPDNGTVNVGLEIDFDWNDLPNAQLYDFELATSPVFEGTVVESAMGLSETAYSPVNQFEFSTLYYWRVRPINECGPGAWSVPFTFHTENTICEGEVAADTPVLIPGTGPLPTITSKINVDFSGTISDINIPNVNVRYQPIQNFDITLISPQSTRVKVYGDGAECFGTDRVNVGFDNAALTPIECPPTTGGLFIPLEDLSIFEEQNTQGEWTLEVKVLETGFGAPGSIDNWEIEFCASGTPSAPQVVTNEGLCIPPGASDEITISLLEVNDDTQSASELEYTIVTVPNAGGLFFNGTELEVGSTFRQSSINSGNLVYANTDASAIDDNFNFVVQDGTGGHLAVTRFDIVLDPVCAVNTNDIPLAEQFRLFPNPSSGIVFLEWGEVTNQDRSLRVFNMQGQLIQQKVVNSGTLNTNIDLSNMPAGVYIIQVGDQGQRVIVE